MKYLSLLEKLKVLFNEFLSYEYVFGLIIIMLLFTILYICKKINNKKYIIFMSLSLIITFMISIIKNYKILSNTFDNFMTIFFNGIYFPSIYIYIGIFVIVLLAFITSIIGSKSRIYKIINSIMLVLNSIFLIMILNIIAENNIDVFQITSLYTNNALVVILELNMLLFIIWLASLAVVYITNAIYNKLTLNKVTVSNSTEEEKNMSIELDTAGVDSNIVEVNDVIEDTNEINKDLVLLNKENIKIQDDNKVTFNDILNGLIPVTYYNNDIGSLNYNISNPQEMYENNYNNVKLELENKNSDVVNNIAYNVIDNINNDDICEYNIDMDSYVDEDKDVVKKTMLLKEENMKKNLVSNTVSLNDLISQDKEIELVDKVITTINNSSYTVDDYKKIISMLKGIKNSSNKNNISIDEAITMSLINNYSIDDCVKFKEILESSLN